MLAPDVFCELTRLTESFTIFLQTCLHLAFSSEHALISYCSVNCPTTFLFPLQKSPIYYSVLLYKWHSGPSSLLSPLRVRVQFLARTRSQCYSNPVLHSCKNPIVLGFFRMWVSINLSNFTPNASSYCVCITFF